MTEMIARRQFAPLYIRLDIGFLVLFLGLLLMKKKYMTALVGIFFGFVYMAAILFAGYLGAAAYNLFQPDRARRIPIPWILAIGILVQFGWEAGLLLGGIRSAGLTGAAKFLPLIVNSLLETNLGMPYIYAIYIACSRRFTEQLRRRAQPVSFTARIAENNAQHINL